MKLKQLALGAILSTAIPLSTMFSQWLQTSGPPQGAVKCFAVSGVTIFAGTDGGRVYASANGGVEWNDVSNGLNPYGTSASVFCLAVKGGFIFAGTEHASVLYRSSDFGLHWDPIGTGLPWRSVQSLFVRGQDIFLGASGDGIFRSSDNGVTCVKADSAILAVGVHGPCLHVQPFDRLDLGEDADPCPMGNGGVADRPAINKVDVLMGGIRADVE